MYNGYKQHPKIICFNDVIFGLEKDKLLRSEVVCNYFDMSEVQQTRHRRFKTNTPREKKDANYYEKRKRNNMAAKKSRDAKRKRDNEVSNCLWST